MWHDLNINMTHAEAINEAHRQVMKDDKNVILVGAGVNEPRGLHGTSSGLSELFGADRVIDMPISESGVTGFCTGAAMMGIKPILVFQNMEYVFLAFNQLITNTVRFSQLSTNQEKMPIVFRIMIGQNWQSEPQLFQSFHTLLSQIKGLKVVMPVHPKDAKGLFIQAVEDPYPVVFIEHRWLYSYKGDVPAQKYSLPLGKANIVRNGTHITVAAFSFAVLQAVRAANVLALQGIKLEVIDMRSAQPLDVNTVLGSIRKTGRLIVIDSGIGDNAIAAELITLVAELGFKLLNSAPLRIDSAKQSVPFDYNDTTDTILENEAIDIAKASLTMMNRNNRVSYDRVIELLHTTEQIDPNIVRL